MLTIKYTLELGSFLFEKGKALEEIYLRLCVYVCLCVYLHNPKSRQVSNHDVLRIEFFRVAGCSFFGQALLVFSEFRFKQVRGERKIFKNFII